jgi:hypothetical protein
MATLRLRVIKPGLTSCTIVGGGSEQGTGATAVAAVRASMIGSGVALHNVPVNLPKSREALARAERMLDDLARHTLDSVAFRDRIPYVLDLLAGVTRTIHAESSGHRTPEFGTWWASVDRSAQQSIQEMRNAELKELISRTAAHFDTHINVSAADFPDLRVNDGDTVTRVTWAFNGGALHGKPVLDTLRDYLQEVTAVLEEAERRLGA